MTSKIPALTIQTMTMVSIKNSNVETLSTTVSHLDSATNKSNLMLSLPLQSFKKNSNNLMLSKKKLKNQNPKHLKSQSILIQKLMRK
jgi:hypothetical protein